MQQMTYDLTPEYNVPDFKCVNPVVHASPKLRIAPQIEQELTPAFLYIRTSTKEQKIYGGSQEEQEIRMNWYAQKNNLNVIEYFRESMSAKEMGRIEWDRMIARAQKHKGRVNIVVYFVDRAFRNPQDFAKLDLLMRKNPQLYLHIISDNKVISAGSSPAEKQYLWNEAGNATKYSLDLSEKVLFGNSNAVKRGFRPTAPPTGYKNYYPKNNQCIAIIDEEKRIVPETAFKLYATGDYSLERLAKHMKVQGLSCNGKTPVNRSSLARMLRNIFYIGQFNYNGHAYKGIHEPLISKELFNEVQRRLDYEKNGTTMEKHEFLYTRLIKCFYCGCIAVGQVKKGKYEYWGCTNRKKDFNCKVEYVRVEEIDKVIEGIFRSISLLSDEKFAIIKKRLIQMHKEKGMFTERTITNIEAELKKVRQSNENLLDLLLRNVIDETTYKHKKAALEAQETNLEAEREKIKESPKNFSDYVKDVLELCKDVHRLYLRSSMQKKRQLIKLVCQNLYLKDQELLVELNPLFKEVKNLVNVVKSGR